jgi:formylglycine-generating enzyme required for sulfatase activity
MVLAPGGSFRMGSQAANDTSPIHAVTLDPFFIDQFEVTNARYGACVSAGGCTAPARRSTDTRPGYFTDPNFAQYPMVNVSWDQAQAFCAWDGGKRLPTEAEWEFAATGGDGRQFPWGNAFDPNLVPVSAGDTMAVGSFPQNASPVGALDMAGNVVEWVADWYKADFYATSPELNPTGPETGSTKAMRGGSFGNADPALYQTTRRFRRAPGSGDVDIGFRCAQSRP